MRIALPLLALAGLAAAQSLPTIEVDRVLDSTSDQTMTLSRDGRKLIASRMELFKPNVAHPRGYQIKQAVHDLRTGQDLALPDGFSMYRSALSPDGSVAYLFGQYPMKPELYRIAVGSSEPPRVILPRVDSTVAVSPDGKRIAYLLRHGADTQMMLTPSIGGGSRQLAAWHGVSLGGTLVWSGDGSSIGVMSVNGTQRTLLGVDVRSGGISEIVSFESSLPDTPFVWPLGDGIYFLRKVATEPVGMFLYQRSAKSWHPLPLEGTAFVASFLQSNIDGSLMLAERFARPPDPWERMWKVITLQRESGMPMQTVVLRLLR